MDNTDKTKKIVTLKEIAREMSGDSKVVEEVVRQIAALRCENYTKCGGNAVTVLAQSDGSELDLCAFCASLFDIICCVECGTTDRTDDIDEDGFCATCQAEETR